MKGGYWLGNDGYNSVNEPGIEWETGSGWEEKDDWEIVLDNEQNMYLDLNDSASPRGLYSKNETQYLARPSGITTPLTNKPFALSLPTLPQDPINLPGQQEHHDLVKDEVKSKSSKKRGRPSSTKTKQPVLKKSKLIVQKKQSDQNGYQKQKQKQKQNKRNGEATPFLLLQKIHEVNACINEANEQIDRLNSSSILSFSNNQSSKYFHLSFQQSLMPKAQNSRVPTDNKLFPPVSIDLLRTMALLSRKK